MPVTDEDIIRDLLHRGTPGLIPPAAMAAEVVARQRRRDRRGRVLSLAAAGAALGTAAGVITLVPGRAPGAGNPAPAARAATTQPAIRLTAGQRVLYRLSSEAAAQPAGQDRYVVMRTQGFDNGVPETGDTSVLDSRTGNLREYQQGTNGAPSGPGAVSRHFSLTEAQFAAMPTGAAALRAALIAQWDAATRPAKQELKALAARPRPVPRNSRPLPQTISAGDKVFQQASALLWNPLLSPQLRSALFRVLAATPGVTVSPSAHDILGRPAVEISRTDTTGYRGNRSDGISYATYENPATGAVLETSTTYPPGADFVSPQDPDGTVTAVEADVYRSISRSDTIPPDPYGG